MKKSTMSFITQFFLSLFMMFCVRTYAENKVTSAVEGADKFTDGVRLVYSKEIEFKAQPNMRFLQFATLKTELGVTPGLTINMLTYDNLAMGGALTELTNMTTQAITGSLKSITVTEYGNSVSASELLIQSSFDDIMATSTTLLSRDYALTVDVMLRNAAVSTAGGTSVIYAPKKDGTKVTARTGIVADALFGTTVVKDGLEILSSANAPMYNGLNWICFIHPHQARTLRDDPAWIAAQNYANTRALFTGEIGMIDSTIFVETTLMPNGACASTDPGYLAALKSGTAGNQVNVFQAVLFGDAYYGLAVSLPVELRDNGVEDFGRKRSLAWYAIFGTGKLHANYGVIIETA